MVELSAFDMYLNEVKNCEILSKKEILELAVKAKRGNRAAREKIARSHLKFVIHLAKNYAVKYNMDFEELVAAGNIGLTIALNKFEPGMNNAFTTYAQFWIRSEMNSLMNKSHDIELPKAKAKELSKTYNTYADSIDDENFNEGSICAEYTESFNPETNYEKEEICSSIKKALGLLTEQEETIIRLHYGIGCEAESLKEIGKHYGLSKERIRQIERAAIISMKGGKAGTYLEGLCA